MCIGLLSLYSVLRHRSFLFLSPVWYTGGASCTHWRQTVARTVRFETSVSCNRTLSLSRHLDHNHRYVVISRIQFDIHLVCIFVARQPVRHFQIQRNGESLDQIYPPSIPIDFLSYEFEVCIINQFIRSWIQFAIYMVFPSANRLFDILEYSQMQSYLAKFNCSQLNQLSIT